MEVISSLARGTLVVAGSTLCVRWCRWRQPRRCRFVVAGLKVDGFSLHLFIEKAQRSGIQFYTAKTKWWCAFCLSVRTSKSPCRARDVMSLIVVHLHFDTDIQSQNSQAHSTSEPLKWFVYAVWETLEKLCRMVIKKEWVFEGVLWAAITYRQRHSNFWHLLAVVDRTGPSLDCFLFVSEAAHNQKVLSLQ